MGLLYWVLQYLSYIDILFLKTVFLENNILFLDVLLIYGLNPVLCHLCIFQCNESG